jgi:enoyl-CoA hydratase
MNRYKLEDRLATVTLDDGKVNALGSAFIADVNAQFDRAIGDSAVAVILSGRPGIFSAGFDLAELRSGSEAQRHLRRELIDLVLRIFKFDMPVVIACTGHALAAGAALLLAADRRIGLDGPFKVGFNEATLGVSISPATVALARYRMPMPWFESIVAGNTYEPSPATDAGFLDTLASDVPDLWAQSRATAESLSQIPRATFVEMRELARRPTVDAMERERSHL